MGFRWPPKGSRLNAFLVQAVARFDAIHRLRHSIAHLPVLPALRRDGAPVSAVIRRLVAMANQRHAWRRDLTALRDQIREEGGLQIGTTKEEVVERLRQTRREIFEAEYAHLYR
jgi:hypothetical protein